MLWLIRLGWLWPVQDYWIVTDCLGRTVIKLSLIHICVHKCKKLQTEKFIFFLFSTCYPLAPAGTQYGKMCPLNRKHFWIFLNPLESVKYYKIKTKSRHTLNFVLPTTVIVKTSSVRYISVKETLGNHLEICKLCLDFSFLSSWFIGN